MNLIIGLLYGIVASILSFIQLQGQFRFNWMRDNPFIIALMGIPISLLLLQSIKHLVSYFEGELWPSRLLGFAIGMIVFTSMTWVWFREPLSMKTIICLILASCIMGVQIFWK